MDDENYSKREIDMFIEAMNEKLDAIHELAKKTNGRVTSLERWKYTMAGGLSVLTLIVVPLLLNILTK